VKKHIKWLLPEPLDSAETHLQVLTDGRWQLTIVHDVLKGISPTMLHWWFANIGGEMIYQGQSYNRYRMWHPHDHIHWALIKPGPNGKAEVGSVFHIVEAFARNPQYFINVYETVEKLDDSGIRLSNVRFGMSVSTLEHTFTAVGAGTLYRSCLLVGSGNPVIGRILNPFVRQRIFPEDMGRAWLKHNVEEVGNLEFFLPALYEQVMRNG
jgi:hypothetical protein